MWTELTEFSFSWKIIHFFVSSFSNVKYKFAFSDGCRARGKSAAATDARAVRRRGKEEGREELNVIIAFYNIKLFVFKIVTQCFI